MNEIPYQNVIFSIGLVIALLTIILIITKKLARKGFGKNKNIDLNIISKIALTPKSYLFIVKASEKTLLIGANDTNVSLISELPTQQKNITNSTINNFPAKLKENPIKQTSNNNQNPTSFSAFLQSQFKKQSLS
ncbi:MAG TPA: flagellar biosynthetic protein FliO [Candidatus Kapabacteria bacterium]|nr:flagellar biosynthetic protein FliO [Candidatus Kapabacteria bacterium]HPO61545.1 flagellar biosynthetic protein FliO [Candidatus Kapabacteria bacterium]